MDQEKLIEVIDKLTEAKITLDQLDLIKPLIGTDDFIESFEIVSGISTALIPISRASLKKYLDVAENNFKKEKKTNQVRNINRWFMPAIAACVLVVCATSIVQSITEYNNPKNYRKIYREK